MRRGPPPKPTALKILEGNPGRRPLPEDEPTPEGHAEPPGWMRPAARKIWDEYAPKLDYLGVLTDIDAEAFAQWCTLASMFRRKPVDMPASKLARMDSLAQQFGLTPSSRTRIKVTPKKPNESPAEKYFRRPA